MDLKELLGDELYGKLEKTEIFQAVKTAFEAKKLIVNDGEAFVSRERLNQEIEKKKAAEAQLAERDKSIEQMQKDLAGLKDIDPKKMKEEIQALTEKSAEAEKAHKAEVQRIQRSAKIREILMGEKVQVKQAYADYIESKLDSNKMAWSEDGSTVTGIDEQIAELKKSYPESFGSVHRNGTPHLTGDPIDTGDKYFTRDQLSKMTPQEMAKDQATLDKVNASYAYLAKQPSN